MLIFSAHDVLKDPPFSRLDLISCRNLLIYLDTEAQMQLIRLFHYALNPGGFLFLGSSETTASAAEMFDTVSRKSKLYVRKEVERGARRVPVHHVSPRDVISGESKVPGRTTLNKTSFRELTERALLEHCNAVGVLVNERGEIVYLHGRTGIYLEPAQGEPGMNILKMARDGLRERLAVALHRAASAKETVRDRGLRVKTNGDYTSVDLTVAPVATTTGGPPDLFLVMLHPLPAVLASKVPMPESETGRMSMRVFRR